MNLQFVYNELDPDTQFHIRTALLTPHLQVLLANAIASIDRDQLSLRPNHSELQLSLQRCCNERDVLNQLVDLISHLQQEQQQ